MIFLRCKVGLGLLLVLLSTAGAQTPTTKVILPDGLTASDWSSICSAHEADQYKATEIPSGFEFRNHGQRWTTNFDGEGFQVRPDSGTWSWGLQLASFGFEGAMQKCRTRPIAEAKGNRVAYNWGENLQEWYLNDARGLEHGYTLKQRPDRGSDEAGPLTFHLSVRGSLRAEVMHDGRGVRFVGPDNTAALSYAGLRVFDATGKDMLASFGGTPDLVTISIQEGGAIYPLTIDPIARQAYLKASFMGRDDTFGNAVAMSGDLVVVGARFEDSHAQGIDGHQTNNWALDSGAAYVFENNGGVWTQLAYLKSSNSDPSDQFGFSVAISGETIVVGAPHEQSNATGVDGDQSNNSNFAGAGAAYVFQRTAGVWSQQAYLKASNTAHQDTFGQSVAISGDTIAVGNTWNSSRTGAVYMFERTAGVWRQQAFLRASNPNSRDDFGSPVSLSDNRLAVGANRESSAASGVNGNEADNSLYEAGAVYVFERVGGVWTQEAYIKASNPGYQYRFGLPVVISGDLLVVGSPLENSDADGVNGDQTNTNALYAGAVYVFRRIGGTWSQEAYLKSLHSDTNDLFGSSVAVLDDRIAVGAVLEDGSATGIDGDQTDNASYRTGAVFIFEKDGSGWAQKTYLKGAVTVDNYNFGGSLALSDSRLLVGTPGDASRSHGINGDPTDTLANRSGAVFVFDLNAPTTSFCGQTVPNSTGLVASMSMAGSIVVADNDFTLHAGDLPDNQFGYFLNSLGRGFIPSIAGSQGTLCLGGGAAMGRHNRAGEVMYSGSSGAIRLTLDLTDVPSALGPRPVVAGETWNFQCWYRDMNPNSASNFTDGLSVQFE